MVTTEGITGTDTIINAMGMGMADAMIEDLQLDINRQMVLRKKKRKLSDKRNWPRCNKMHQAWKLIGRSDSGHWRNRRRPPMKPRIERGRNHQSTRIKAISSMVSIERLEI